MKDYNYIELKMRIETLEGSVDRLKKMVLFGEGHEPSLYVRVRDLEKLINKKQQ